MENTTLLKGPVLKGLLKFAVPVLLALFLQALYGAVDLWAVGKFASPADMSAVSTGSQAMLVITGFITGLSMGITVLLGKRMGERDFQKAGEVLGASLWLLLGLGIAVTVLLVLFAPAAARFTNAPPEALHQTEAYLRICGAGTVFIVAYNGISSLFRGIGDSRSPLLFVAIACIINVAGDLFLIRQLHMGAAGAAIATVLAQGVSALLSLIFIKKHGLPFPVTKKSFALHADTLKHILKLGLPIGFSDMCNEVCYLILIGFTNTLGVIASAGVGVAEKLIVFLLLIPMSYMSSISSFTAQNTGAGQAERARKGMWQGMATAVVLGILLSALLFFGGGTLSLLFNKDPEVLASSALFLKATALECLILSAAFCFTGYFNGLGKTGFVMAQGLASIFLVKIPYGYIAMRFMDNALFQIGLSTVWGALFTLLACILFYIHLRRKEKKSRP